MIKAIVINVGKQANVCEIKEGYKEKLRIVEGDYLECVTLDDKFEKVMYINESGKLDGLPINHVATQIYRHYLSTDDFIAGNAVICACDSEGDTCDLTQEQINEILGLLA